MRALCRRKRLRSRPVGRIRPGSPGRGEYRAGDPRRGRGSGWHQSAPGRLAARGGYRLSAAAAGSGDCSRIDVRLHQPGHRRGGRCPGWPGRRAVCQPLLPEPLRLPRSFRAGHRPCASGRSNRDRIRPLQQHHATGALRGCHLCEDLIEELADWLGSAGDFEVRDVDTRADWIAEYGTRVPVVEYDGRLICQYHLDREALAALPGMPQAT